MNSFGGVIRLPLDFSKSAYLLILMIISVDFFHFTPFAFFANDDICLVLFLLWIIAGHFLFKPLEGYLSITIRRYYWPIVFVWGGVLISFFAAKALYGQSLITSLVASRAMLAMMALPAMGIVNPGMKDIEKATVGFSVILLLFSVLDAVGAPILDREAYIDGTAQKEFIDDDSFVACLPGFHWVAMALFFYLDRLKNNFSFRDLAGSLFLFAEIFCLQNRSMLFISTIFVVYTFLSVRGGDQKQTFVMRGSAILLIVAMVGVTVPQWIKLITETAGNLGNEDYNRILAYNYFLFQACPNPIYYFSGMGFISANTSSIMMDLMKMGIYNSDVGFIGLWNHYGLLPIVAILIVSLQALRKGTPLFVIFNALFILGSSLTLACFTTPDKLLWLSMFIYMVYSHRRPSSAERPVIRRRVVFA